MRRSTRLLMLLGLLALLLVDVALVGLVWRDRGGETAATTGRKPSPITSPLSSPSPSVTTSPAEPRDRAGRPGPVLLSRAATGEIAWALGGACHRSHPVLRFEGHRVALPATSLLRVNAVGGAEMWAIGTDDTCTPRFLRTVDGGQTWTTQPSTATVWHLLPSNGVHAPDGPVAAPCKRPVDLSVFSATGAALLCANGSVFVTSTGSTWSRAGEAARAEALAFVDAARGFVATPGSADGDCSGTSVATTSDGGTSWQVRGCAAAASGPVAIDFSSARDGVLADSRGVFATDDGGRTWTAR